MRSLQSATDDPEDNRVVWTCCKNNDGPLGPREAWERCNGLFSRVDDFDFDAFDDRGDKKPARRSNTPDLIKAILKGHPEGMTRAELKEELVEAHGFGSSGAYN